MSEQEYDQGIEELKRYINSERYREGLDHLELLANHPMAKSDQARIYYFSAVCLQGLNTDYRRALEYYSLALENGFKQEFWVFYNRSLLYLQLGDLEAARVDIDHAVSLNPLHKDARQIRDDLFLPPGLDVYQQQIKLASPILACCVGKSGTVLLANILTAILGDNLVIPSNTFRRPLVTSEYILGLPNLTNRVYIGHIWYSEGIAKKLLLIPKIILIRDPRDNVVSYSHFIDRRAKDIFGSNAEYWSKKDWDEKLSTMIFGMRTPAVEFPSVYNSYLNYGIRWAGPRAFVVRYEDIMGTKFGGNDNTVIKTIKSLMDFMGVQIDEDMLVRRITQGSDPAKSQTFRAGGEGSWRHEFKPKHVTQMKAAAPNLVSALGYEDDEMWDLNTKMKKRDLSKININPDCLSEIASLDTTIYFQIRKDSEGKNELERLVDEWALKIFIERNQYQDAVLISEQLVKQDVTNPLWNYLNALCLHQLRGEQYTHRALHYYNFALENGVDEFWVRYNRGSLLAEAGEKEAAVADLERALSLNPQNKTIRDMLTALQAEKDHF